MYTTFTTGVQLFVCTYIYIYIIYIYIYMLGTIGTIGIIGIIGVDWRWSGLEKKMKWIGLEWRKGGEIGEKSCPKTHFLEKTHKTHFPKTKTSIFRKKKKPRRDTPWKSLGGPGGPARPKTK